MIYGNGNLSNNIYSDFTLVSVLNKLILVYYKHVYEFWFMECCIVNTFNGFIIRAASLKAHLGHTFIWNYTDKYCY